MTTDIAEVKRNLNVPTVLHDIRAPPATPPVSTAFRKFKLAKSEDSQIHTANRFKKQPELGAMKARAVASSYLTSTPISATGQVSTLNKSPEKNATTYTIDQLHSKMKAKLLKHKQREYIDSSESPQADNEGSSYPSRDKTDTDTVSGVDKRAEFSLHERLDKYLTSGLPIASGAAFNRTTAGSMDGTKRNWRSKLKQKLKRSERSKKQTDNERDTVDTNSKPVSEPRIFSGGKKHPTSNLPTSPRKYISLDSDIDIEKGEVAKTVTTEEHATQSKSKPDSKLRYERELTDISVELGEGDLVIEHVVSVPNKNRSNDLNYQSSINIPGKPQRYDSNRSVQPSVSVIDNSSRSNIQTSTKEQDKSPTEKIAAKATESLNEAIDIVLDLGSYISPIETNTDDLSFDYSVPSTITNQTQQTMQTDRIKDDFKNTNDQKAVRADDESIAEADLSNITYRFTWDNEEQMKTKRVKRNRKRNRFKDISFSGESEKYFDSGSSFYSGRKSRDEIDDDLVRHIKSRESYC